LKNLYFNIILLSFFVVFSAKISAQINAGYIACNFDFAESGKNIFGNLIDGENPIRIELSTFNARVIKNDVHLSWQTKTKVNSYKFKIERISSEDMIWKNIGEVKVSDNSNSPKFYSFKDKNLAGGIYSYRLKIIYNDNSFEFSDEIHTEINYTDNFELSQNFPNPFNPSTIITYKLPEKSFVSLKVFNVLGNEITTLVNEEKPAGIHNVKFDVLELPKELSNGTYFYRLKVGNFTETKKMIYIK